MFEYINQESYHLRLIILLIISMLMNIFPIQSYSNVTYAKEKDYEAHWALGDIELATTK